MRITVKNLPANYYVEKSADPYNVDNGMPYEVFCNDGRMIAAAANKRDCIAYAKEDMNERTN